MTNVTIRPARADEASLLSDLAFRSKSHWGYDQDFMEQCRPALTYTPEECEGHMYVAQRGAAVVGFGRLIGSPPTGILDALFVDPAEIGRGVGGALFRHIVQQARSLGFTRLELDSDPHAQAFYARHGAEFVRDVPSDAIPGRTLPRMRLTV